MSRKLAGTFDHYKFGFKTKTQSVFKSAKGLTKKKVEEISKRKGEPKWMLEYRLKAYDIFKKMKMPKWGADLSKLDLQDLHYYIQPQDKPKTKWSDVPKEIKTAFDKLGIPQSERKFFAGTGAQFESEIVYHSLQRDLQNKGVIFDSTDAALLKYPEIFKEHFGKIVPANDNKFAALNAAVWSGGSFIYVPKGVHVDLPLQAYFRINTQNMGQFERTLIIVEEGASLHYLEGCTAPVYSTESLHAAVVEVIVKEGAHFQYTTVQNWSHNIYNLVTKRAHAHKNAEVKWLDINLGSYVTMKYPAIYLLGEGAKGETHALALAGKDQHQDSGTKIIHAAPNTSSKIISKSISKSGGRSSYRGLLQINKGAKNVKSHVSCDALLLDENSRSDTYPTMKINENDVSVEHEATVSRISEEQLFYLKSRGFSEEEAATTIVNGFANPIVKKLPVEYALELNRLLEMEMEGSVA